MSSDLTPEELETLAKPKRKSRAKKPAKSDVLPMSENAINHEVIEDSDDDRSDEKLSKEDEKRLQARFIERLAKQIDEDFEHDPATPRVNAYVCSKCAHVEFTVDVSSGTTPVSVPCLSEPIQKKGTLLDTNGNPLVKEIRCEGVMQSSFYAVKPDDYDLDSIKYEWRSPEVEFYLRLRRKKSKLANHIMRGGLILCHRRPNTPVLRHDGEFMHENGTILTDEEVGAHRSSVERLRVLCALHEHTQRRKEAARKKEQDKKRASLRAKRKAKNKSRRR